jgi:hypothetical protein
MATADDLRRLAMALEGTTSAPHSERIVFKVARIYATLGPDDLTANLKLGPDEQESKCPTAPDVFQPVPNAWGRQGWTAVTLAVLSRGGLGAAMRLAGAHALPKTRRARTRKSKR